jgi:hypothetical protein
MHKQLPDMLTSSFLCAAEVQCGGLKDRFKLKDTHQINSNLYCWEMCSALRRKSRLLPTLVTQQPNSMGIFGRHLHHTLFRDFYDPRVKREWWQTHALMFMSTGLRELGQGIQAGRFQVGSWGWAVLSMGAGGEQTSA